MFDKRTISTLLVWGFSFGIVAVISSSAVFGGFGLGQTIVSFFAVLGAVAGTGFVWGFGETSHDEASSKAAKLAKAKRGDPLEAILQRLSDEELLELRERMKDAQFTLDERGNLVRK